MKDRLKKVKQLLSKAKKLGLDLAKVTEGKSIESLAKSKTTIANLEKRFKRQKERPKIVQEVKKYEENIKKKKIRNLITLETKNEFKYNNDLKNQELNNKNIKKQINKISTDFFDTYFKQIKFEHSAQKKINKLKKRFGLRLDLVYDFMDYIQDQSFKYEVDRDFMREEMPDDFATLLYERLEEFDRILNREFKI